VSAKRSRRLEWCAGIWILMFATMAVGRAITISGNFDTNAGYSADSGAPVGNAFDGNTYAEATSFVPSSSTTFAALAIALSCTAACPGSFTVALASDIDGQPGALLEAFTVSGENLGPLGSNNTPLVLNSLSHPVLAAGARYWIEVISDSNESIAWNFNSTGDASSPTISSDGGLSWFSPLGMESGAFQVYDNQPFVAGGQALSAAAGGSSINLVFPPGFAWAATSSASWLTVSGPISGTGSGTLSYQVTANPGSDRSATITVAGSSFVVEQEAGFIPGLNQIGSMAHFAAEENWNTTFTLVNKSAAPAQGRLSLFGDAADPSGDGPVIVPLTFPQQTLAAGPLLASSFDRTIAANASLMITTAGPKTPPVLVGSAQLAATGAVDGFAIFHHVPTAQEAVVPMETRNASSYLLPVNNIGGIVLGVAVENLSALAATIPVTIRDFTGTVISPPGTSISLSGNGHTAFVFSDSVFGFPVMAASVGTIEFDTPVGGKISVLGIRFSPPNNALTTIPALANVGIGGGSIAHLAAGGDGWETTFVLVNTGISSAEATLSFFDDVTGNPLSLPITYVQAGNNTVASSITQTLAAGATLMVASSGSLQLLTGSAQLSTNGHVTGFVIFRHNDQEAVVPLESRNAAGYIIAFDNTKGTATGVALNAVSAQRVSVPVVVRDETGAQIATDTITLNANGHYAFTLGTDRYPGTANIRGTVEFDTPAGGQIGALGIRIPTGAAHTYTTLPALAK